MHARTHTRTHAPSSATTPPRALHAGVRARMEGTGAAGGRGHEAARGHQLGEEDGAACVAAGVPGVQERGGGGGEGKAEGGRPHVALLRCARTELQLLHLAPQQAVRRSCSHTRHASQAEQQLTTAPHGTQAAAKQKREALERKKANQKKSEVVQKVRGGGARRFGSGVSFFVPCSVLAPGSALQGHAVGVMGASPGRQRSLMPALGGRCGCTARQDHCGVAPPRTQISNSATVKKMMKSKKQKALLRTADTNPK